MAFRLWHFQRLATPHRRWRRWRQARSRRPEDRTTCLRIPIVAQPPPDAQTRSPALAGTPRDAIGYGERRRMLSKRNNRGRVELPSGIAWRPPAAQGAAEHIPACHGEEGGGQKHFRNCEMHTVRGGKPFFERGLLRVGYSAPPAGSRHADKWLHVLEERALRSAFLACECSPRAN